ncbi:DNA alkylation repair protein [Aerococcus urinaeequi]|uniref:DNA alkylation repair protein n=1 Tax=Aerococcus urinaeequi TaxID=51665 RepID=UPI003AAE1BDE
MPALVNTDYLMEEMYDHRSEDAVAMAKYQRDQFPFIGIKSQLRRDIFKPYLKEMKRVAKVQAKENTDEDIIDWAFVKAFWDLPEREFQYIVCDYLKEMKQFLKPDDLEKLQELVISKSWWDSVDSLVKTIGYLVHQHPQLKSVMVDWSQSDNIWLKRTAMIYQLGMKAQTDVDLLEITCANCLGSSEFFINKGMGWILRDYAKTNQTWVENFLKNHESDLSNLTWREATKYFYLEKNQI